MRRPIESVLQIKLLKGMSYTYILLPSILCSYYAMLHDDIEGGHVTICVSVLVTKCT